MIVSFWGSVGQVVLGVGVCVWVVAVPAVVVPVAVLVVVPADVVVSVAALVVVPADAELGDLRVMGLVVLVWVSYLVLWKTLGLVLSLVV